MCLICSGQKECDDVALEIPAAVVARKRCRMDSNCCSRKNLTAHLGLLNLELMKEKGWKKNQVQWSHSWEPTSQPSWQTRNPFERNIISAHKTQVEGEPL